MNPNTITNNVKIKNKGPKMWITMKTYKINNEADIYNILVSNNIKHLNNSFEIPFKDVKKCTKQLNKLGMDMVLFDAHVVPLTMVQSNSSFSLVKENSENYFVSFVNIKNEKEEYLSSLVNNLSQHYRFVINDGVILKNFSTFNINKLTVAVRPENNSSIFLFKCEQHSKSLEHLISLAEENLSKITNTGVYSLFGHVTNITKYPPNEAFIILRIRCFDKCVIKFQKYPQLVDEAKKNISNDITLPVNYDFSSNFVDVLIKNPCDKFLTLKINQRIFLYKVIVKYSNNLEIFSLCANGKAKYLKADPIETNSVKSLRPPNKQFPIPNELMPLTRTKTKEIPFSKDVLKNTKKPSSNVKQTTTNLNELLSSSSDDDDDDDDNVNLSPCGDFLTSKCNLNVNNGVSRSSYKTNDIIQKNINIFSPDKRTDLNSVNKVLQSTPKKQLICLEKESSSDSTGGSFSPSFFKTSKISEFRQDNQLTKSHSRTAQCIGPCRLLSVELKMDNIVCGYCTKCCVFFPKTLLIKFVDITNVVKYTCPKCSDSVSFTLFFKMIFSYESTDCQTIEVCCYNENAKHVLKKLLKKNVKLDNFLKNSNYRYLFDNVIKLLIKNHTKMNIVICHSPMDNANILLSLDKEFTVSNSINLI